ncbi:hypothetical protein DEU56DRAFT_752399 [Suillus clintonianus]|uniref:uncharacterized protein n=1 Tax=Suillus clintonianus TaxID=1904413 RepID=UPI001B86F8C7|nr:uncharacterized protein DEU56DRAFT_752399 [Suillus clintonianus]KAG2151506.1 hypothetical protein DEU56DRAFT_752399 [Suillus clintonianus]
MGNSISHISGQKSGLRESQDSLSTTASFGTNIDTLTKAPLKRKFEFDDDSVSPRKRRLLECYSMGDISHVVAMPRTINRRNTDFTNPSAKRLYREASDIFLKRKADTVLDPFSIQRVNLYEPCTTQAFIWSLPAEMLTAIVALLGAQDLRCVTQVCSLLREIAGPLFFVNRSFPTSPQDMFHIQVDSYNFDVLLTWIRMDTFRPPRMMLCWLDPDVRSTQLSAFSHFLQSVPHKSIRYITLFWNFDILTCLVLPQIITVFENIRASGCEDLTCMGFCSRVGSSSVTGLTRIQGRVNGNLLKTFDASSQAFFSPKLLPFTIQTIRSSRLEKLRLSSIKLSSAHWDRLLRHLAVPTLVELRVDADCAPSTLIRFLARHPGVNNLSVIPQPGTQSAVHVRHLAIRSSTAAGDALALSASWIEAFPLVKRVSMQGCSNLTAEDLIHIMRKIADDDVELSVNLRPEDSFIGASNTNRTRIKVLVLPTPTEHGTIFVEYNSRLTMPLTILKYLPAHLISRIFLCKCTRCCEVGGDGMPRNPGGKELPFTMKHVHSLQAASIASSPREASVLHLARQALFEPSDLHHITDRQASSSQHLVHPTHEPTTSTPVDDLAAELFAITLSDDKADPDSHSKLWVSRSEVQRDKEKSCSLDFTTNLLSGLTLDDTQ